MAGKCFLPLSWIFYLHLVAATATLDRLIKTNKLQSKIKCQVMANLEIKNQSKDDRGNDSGLVFAYLELENSQRNSDPIPDEEINYCFSSCTRLEGG